MTTAGLGISDLELELSASKRAVCSDSHTAVYIFWFQAQISAFRESTEIGSKVLKANSESPFKDSEPYDNF